LSKPVPDLSLTDWSVLGVVCEHPTHGFAVAQEFTPAHTLGRVWTVRRPLVYRSITTLLDKGFVVEQGDAPSERGPQRTMLRATPAGRAALKAWLGRPVEHVRDLRSELLVKLALLDRVGASSKTLVDRQLAQLAPVLDVLKQRPRGDDFDAVVARWRREQALAVERFLRSLN
jgi:PadR family transcriptional regulator AphA